MVHFLRNIVNRLGLSSAVLRNFSRKTTMVSESSSHRDEGNRLPVYLECRGRYCEASSQILFVCLCLVPSMKQTSR